MFSVTYNKINEKGKKMKKDVKKTMLISSQQLWIQKKREKNKALSYKGLVKKKYEKNKFWSQNCKKKKPLDHTIWKKHTKEEKQLW